MTILTKAARGALAVALVVSLSACQGIGRRAGILADPLPPARGHSVGEASSDNLKWLKHRLPGETQVDLLEILEKQVPPANHPELEKLDAEQKFNVLVLSVDKLPPSEAVTVRNGIVGQLINASMANCSVYLRSLRGSQVSSRTLFDILTSSLSTAGGIAAPARSAKLLSSLASLSNAWGSSLDRDVFAEQGVELVARAIEGERETTRIQIQDRMASSYDEWPLAIALADVGRFHSQCSMLHGLTLVRNAVQTRDRDLQMARNVAARVAAAGGDEKQVVAAVQGVAESDLDSLQAAKDGKKSANAVVAADFSESYWGADLAAMRERALHCLNNVETVMLADAKATAVEQEDHFKGTSEKVSCGGDDAWYGAFNAFAAKALADEASDLDKALKDPADDKARRKAITDAFANVRARFNTAAENRRLDIVGRRLRTLAAVDTIGKVGGDVAKLKDEVKTAAGRETDDPVLAAAQGAVEGIDPAKQSARTAADVALVGARSQMEAEIAKQIEWDKAKR